MLKWFIEYKNEFQFRWFENKNRQKGMSDCTPNGSQLKNPDISGAIFTLSLSIRVLNSQCVEGARDARVL